MAGKSNDQIIGYKYHLGLHLALSYPVDEMQLLTIADRVAWSGSAADGSITIDKPNLLGGEDREGGVGGTIDILNGDKDQTVNSYLSGVIGGVIPAFRGVFSLMANRFYIGNNPYLKNWAAVLKRTDIHTDRTPMWYVAKSNINGGDMNPAHIIRECLTNSEWGMDYPTTIIDDDSFAAAADTLYDEAFGLSMQWAQQESIEEFGQRVLDLVDGMLKEDATTGLIGLNLIRGDYVAASLPLFDESNTLTLDSFERRAWGETVNEVTVVYHDRSVFKDLPVTVQDLANIQIQGSVISQSRSYPAVPNRALAKRLAMRDLKSMSTPLSLIKIQVNREAYALRRGGVFRFSWARFGLVEVVYRVTNIHLGDMTNGRITIDAIEDIFGLPDSTYVGDQGSEWTSPNTEPVDVTYKQLIEASYWDIQTTMRQADIEQLDPDFGFALAHAVRPSGDSYHYKIFSRTGGGDYANFGTGHFCPSAVLVGALGIAEGGLTDAVISVTDAVDLGTVTVDSLAYLGDEALAIRSVDTVAGTVTVDRGVVDSVPVAHLAGDRIWFVGSTYQGKDRGELIEAQSREIKLLPVTSMGTLDIADATSTTVVMAHRYQRPYPPGNVTFNGSDYPASITGEVTVAWSHRDRTQQTAYLNNQTEGSIGPELGITYTLRLYDETDTLQRTETALTGTSYVWSTEEADCGLGRLNTQIRIELETDNNGLVSRQFHDITVVRV